VTVYDYRYREGHVRLGYCSGCQMTYGPGPANRQPALGRTVHARRTTDGRLDVTVQLGRHPGPRVRLTVTDPSSARSAAAAVWSVHTRLPIRPEHVMIIIDGENR